LNALFIVQVLVWLHNTLQNMIFRPAHTTWYTCSFCADVLYSSKVWRQYFILLIKNEKLYLARIAFSHQM